MPQVPICARAVARRAVRCGLRVHRGLRGVSLGRGTGRDDGEQHQQASGREFDDIDVFLNRRRAMTRLPPAAGRIETPLGRSVQRASVTAARARSPRRTTTQPTISTHAPNGGQHVDEARGS